jgi:hypothetical protein
MHRRQSHENTDHSDEDGKSDEIAAFSTGIEERQTGKAAMELLSYSLLWWTLLALSSLLLKSAGMQVDKTPNSVIGRAVSRRLVRFDATSFTIAVFSISLG